MDIAVVNKILYLVMAVMAVAMPVYCVMVVKSIRNKKIGILVGILRILSGVFCCFVLIFAFFFTKDHFKKMGENVLALHPRNISEVTYGDVFNEYCSDMKWAFLYWDKNTEGEKSLIQLNGKCTYKGEKHDICAQFDIGKREYSEYEEEPWFLISFIALDGKDEASEEEEQNLLYDMFTQYIEEKGLNIAIPENEKKELLYSEESPQYEDDEEETSSEAVQEETTEEETTQTPETTETETQESEEESGGVSEIAHSTEYIDTYELSGGYLGNTYSDDISISMYSSQEPGEIYVGTLTVYLGKNTQINGDLYEVDTNVYAAETDYGVITLGFYFDMDGVLSFEMYLDDEFVDSFAMYEQYIS